MGKQETKKVFQLAFWGLIRNEAGERNRVDLGKDFVGHVCELELNPVTVALR